MTYSQLSRRQSTTRWFPGLVGVPYLQSPLPASKITQHYHQRRLRHLVYIFIVWASLRLLLVRHWYSRFDVVKFYGGTTSLLPCRQSHKIGYCHYIISNNIDTDNQTLWYFWQAFLWWVVHLANHLSILTWWKKGKGIPASLAHINNEPSDHQTSSQKTSQQAQL